MGMKIRPFPQLQQALWASSIRCAGTEIYDTPSSELHIRAPCVGIYPGVVLQVLNDFEASMV